MTLFFYIKPHLSYLMREIELHIKTKLISCNQNDILAHIRKQ